MKAKTGDQSGGREEPVLNDVVLSTELLTLNAALRAEGGDIMAPHLDELARELRTAGAKVGVRSLVRPLTHASEPQ